RLHTADFRSSPPTFIYYKRPQAVDINTTPGLSFSSTEFMTTQQAEAILIKTEVKIAFQHRFAGDSGTILRLDNYAMINIFDDGRYYIQGENTAELIVIFSQIEKPWDPDTWNEVPQPILPWFPPLTDSKRFEL